MGCTVYWSDIGSNWPEQLFHKFFDVPSDTFVDEGLADAIAGRDEILALFHLNPGSDEFGVQGCGSKFEMQRFAVAEDGNWKIKHCFIKMALPPLALRLPLFNSRSSCLAIEDGAEKSSFSRVGTIHPV